MRLVQGFRGDRSTRADEPARADVPAGDLVELDRDHPGFRDPSYRARRNAIARLALEHRAGSPLPEVLYTDEEHGVFRVVLENLAPLHEELACAAYREAFPRVGFLPDRIPGFADVTRVLDARTGFRLAPVAGLVTPRVFMERLADGVFLATQYMRHPSAPLYTPEPDVVHELVGHAPLLADPAFSRIHRLFGAATRAVDAATVEALIRIYWFTMEFGVARERDALRVCGAGLLSSFGELGGFRDRAELRPFDLDAIAATPFDPTDYQRVLFVAESTEAMLGELERFLGDVAGRRR
jgi:phenylalanine-4-hydroxylase